MAKADITIYLEANGKFSNVQKYQLTSPVSNDPVDFIGSHRFVLPENSVQLVIQIVDSYDNTNIFEYKKNIDFQPRNKGIDQSEIQLLASASPSNEVNDLTKHGFAFEPLPYNFSNKDSTLIFFNEIYKTDQFMDNSFVVGYKINLGYFEELGQKIKQGYKKYQVGPTVPVLISMDVTDIISGNYSLVIEVMNRNKEVLSSQYINFQRSNPVGDYQIVGSYNAEFSNSFVHGLPKNKLDYYLKALKPVAPYHLTGILANAISNPEIEPKQYFIFKYWTDLYGKNSEVAFEQYMKVADAVHEEFFTGFGFGFESDRGYTYLKYGRPDDVLTVEDEPSAPPYEIWRYDKIEQNGQSNVKFLFYNPSIATNDFDLLHSTCRLEKQNPAWEVELYKSAYSEDNRNNINATTVQPGINRNARRYFEEF